MASNDIKTTIEKAIAAKDLPACVAAASKDGQLIFHEAFGLRSSTNKTPVEVTDRFRIMSQTKAIVSCGVLQLIEQGKLTAKTPLHEILPELHDLKVLDGFDASGNAILRPPKRMPNITDILTHTAGFMYDAFDKTLDQYARKQGWRSIKKVDMLKFPIRFDPGTKWEYGTGIDYAGFVIEQVTGQRLGGYLSENIFKPLGMTSTSYKQLADNDPTLVPLVSRKGNDFSNFKYPEKNDYDSGGGGLCSNASDYLKFLNGVLAAARDEPGAILKKATVDEYVLKNHLPDGLYARTLSPSPIVSGNDFIPSNKLGHSLAFAINLDSKPGMRPTGSIAWAGLFNTHCWLDVKNGVAGVFQVQMLPFTDERVIASFYEYERKVYKALLGSKL